MLIDLAYWCFRATVFLVTWVFCHTLSQSSTRFTV
jgi:hypothetical protein